MNHNTMRELIGLPPEVDFGEAEAVQAIVVWSNPASKPMAVSSGNAGAMAAMSPIARRPLSSQVVPYGSIVATHEDCVAPGVAVREVRPPLTELNPFLPQVAMQELSMIDEPPGGDPLRKVLLKRKPTRDFARQSISRDQFLLMNRLAFRTGTYFPLLPDGPHCALVRPFWIVHDVSGMDPGVWYYHPPADKWVTYNPGNLRLEAQYLSVEQPMCGNAAAVCFFAVDLPALMTQAGPDTYRLAHLEAGVTAQRMLLAANSMGLGCAAMAAFYDDELRQFFGLQQTGWQFIYELAVGVNVEDAEQAPDIKDEWEDGWRG
jgi:SagB-type dehydrogenase family enzyme